MSLSHVAATMLIIVGLLDLARGWATVYSGGSGSFGWRPVGLVMVVLGLVLWVLTP